MMNEFQQRSEKLDEIVQSGGEHRELWD